MTSGPERHRPLNAQEWSALKLALKRFEEAWRQGPRPVIDEYLQGDDPLRHRLVVELVHIDLELRLKAGEPARVEEYLARYPNLGEDRIVVCDLLAAEYQLRRRGDPQVGLDDYLLRFPQYRDDLQGILQPATLAGESARQDTPRSSAGSHLETPCAVPGYEILEPLGRGGMGVVYKARQLSLDRLVALKFLPEECVRDRAWLQRFRREALTASALNHPHICTIYDSGESAGRPFLSMELIHGRALAELIGAPLPVDELARLIGQVATALAAAHACGVVHRDIKPHNLMVRDDGIMKVLDFGLARRLPLGQAQDSLSSGAGTAARGLVGTVPYMSPEQARAEAVGTAGDVFSLGVVLYELTTGRHPFQRDTEASILHAIMHETPLPPLRLNPEIPSALDALIQRMLARDPGLRPTAAEVDAALAALSRPGSGHSTIPKPRSGARPTVGRRHERAALHAGFESAEAGNGLFLCVTGEPGVGKTTVVEDFLAEVEAGNRTFTLTRGRCTERLAGTEAYLPLLEALDGLLHGSDEAFSAQAMKLLAPTWYVQLVPLAAADPSLAPGLAEAEGASQERRKRELGHFLHEMSRRRPLVIFLDDIHWADPSSVDFLAFLGVRCAEWRLLLILTYRPSDLLLSQHPFGPVQLELQGRGICREIALPFFTREDVDRYLALAFAGHGFPEEFTDAIHLRTGGIPLFLVDLLCYLRDCDVLVPARGRWTVARAIPDLKSDLPVSIRSMIQRKVDRLAEADRHLLMAATVEGTEFDSAVLARVLGWEAIQVEERLDVLERIHALVRLVREHELAERTPSRRYTFVHALYHHALYTSLVPTRKAALSAAVAQALLDLYGERQSDVAGRLGLLFEAARQPRRAIEYVLLATQNAVRIFAHQEAIALARWGLELLEKLPDAPAHTREELALLLSLGVSLVATRGFASPDVEETYLRARAVCLRAEDHSALFPVLYGLWNVSLLRCELSRCKDLAMQMFDLARGQSDQIVLLQAHNVLQQPLLHLGELVDARRHQEQGLVLYDPTKHGTLTMVYGEDPGISFLTYAAVTLWCLGYPDRALRSVQAARWLAEELSHPFNLARALYFAAFTHLCRREEQLTRELAEALMKLSSEQGFALLLHGGMILHGWCLAMQGEATEGMDQMRQGLSGWQATGALSHRPYQLALLAEVLGSKGRIEDGLAALEEALALATASGERFLEAELHRLRGELLLERAGAALQVGDEVEACFLQALEVARRQRAKSLELRAVVSLSRFYQQQGRPSQARTLLTDIYAWFTEGVELRDLEEARALLAELS
jgi:predicted ATPase